MSLNSYDPYDNPSERADLKTQAEELLRQEYSSYDNSLRWRIGKAKLYLNREERLQQIMAELAIKKESQKKEDLSTVDFLKAQLNDGNQIVVNADRTPVWQVDSEDLVQNRRKEAGQLLKEEAEPKIFVNTNRTPAWQVKSEDLVQSRYDEAEKQIKINE